ncbi:MAG: hypothetical protein M1834_007443 [Cirrosporium novae-zelandiae]|nr:MAG: hypothetical protein M1834_007443 [Cirrosporium novae-zelandiae]
MESHHRLEIRLTLDPLSLHSTFIVNGEPTAQKTFQQVDCAELWLATLQSIAQATVVSEGQALPLQQGTRYAAHILGQSQDNAHKRPKRKGSDPKIPQLPTPSTTTASSPNFAETSIFTVEQINPREHNNPQPSLFPDTLSWMEIEPPVINYSENLNIGNARNSWRSSSVPNESSSSTTEHDHVFTVASGSDSNSVSTAPSPHGVASARIESIECAPQTAPIKWVDTLQSASQSATHKRRPNRNKSISRLPRGNFERTLQAPVDAVRSPSPIPLNAIDQRASTCIERMNKLKRSLESIRQAPVPTMRDHNEKVRSIYTRCKYSSAIVPQSPEEFGQLLGELGGVSSALGVVYGLLSWEVFRREEQRLVREEHLSPRWAAKRVSYDTKATLALLTWLKVNDKMAQQSNRHARTKDWASDGRRAAEMVFDALQGLSAGSRSCALFSLSGKLRSLA